MDCKWLETKLLGYKKYAVDEMENNKFGVCYCIKYKPVGSLEWILARGRWNDRGIRTANGIFNDGIV